MKPETEAAIRKQPREELQKIAHLVVQLLPVEDWIAAGAAWQDAFLPDAVAAAVTDLSTDAFVDALYVPPPEGQQGDPELSGEGLSILTEFIERDGGYIEAPSYDDIDRLHAAICEGRKQDALDMLSAMIGGTELRPVRDQNYLFPDRVTHDLF